MSTLSGNTNLTPTDLQAEVATALQDFYNFLALLPWLDPSDILTPPAGGWPNINEANFAPLHKTDTVIQLLKHIPYLRMGDSDDKNPLVWQTFPCDYQRDYFQKVQSAIDYWEIPNTSERGFEFPEWVVPLTYGKVNGQYIMLDTSDGIVPLPISN